MWFLKLTNGVPSGDTVRHAVETATPEQPRASLGYAREHIVSLLKGCTGIRRGLGTEC